MKMMKMFSFIPLEIVEHILSRLPVKSLLRFRCVSTSWLCLIDSSDFVKCHLYRSIESNTNLSLVLADHLIRRQSVDEVSLIVNTIVPLEIPKRYDQIHGSCNGLVCLSDGFRSLILWNPSTRKFRVLPQSPRDRAHPLLSLSTRCGFGYDSVNDDYKVVMIFLSEEDKLFDVDAYSLKFNTWHTIEKQPRHVHLGSVGLGNGVLAGGALHWVDDHNLAGGPLHWDDDQENHGYNYIRRHIVAFDLATEECLLVPRPEYPHRDYPVALHNFNGCLSVVCNDYETSFSIWVMKEYRLKESWTKLVSVADSRVLEAMTSFPLAYHPNDFGGILVYYKERWILLSLDGEKIVETIIIAGIDYLCDHSTCFGSLVPIN